MKKIYGERIKGKAKDKKSVTQGREGAEIRRENDKGLRCILQQFVAAAQGFFVQQKRCLPEGVIAGTILFFGDKVTVD